MPTTTRADYLFKVSEYADGTPWISTESLRGPLPVIENGLLGFDLPEGTTFEQAKSIANWLNDSIGAICYTDFSDK